VTLDENDIARYRTESEPAARIALVLGPTGSAKLRRASGKERLDWGVCQEGPFTASLDGRRLFTGQCYHLYGAALLPHPVLHVRELDDGVVELDLGAVQGAWLHDVLVDEQARRRIDQPGLRVLFASLGKLEPLADPPP
jgi:hypothetical protein